MENKSVYRARHNVPFIFSLTKLMSRKDYEIHRFSFWSSGEILAFVMKLTKFCEVHEFVTRGFSSLDKFLVFDEG